MFYTGDMQTRYVKYSFPAAAGKAKCFARRIFYLLGYSHSGWKEDAKNFPRKIYVSKIFLQERGVRQR